MTRARGWGSWTVVKLDALERYLASFTSASRRAPATLYLDLFAGAPDNVERDTGESFAGSAERALKTSPPFTRVALFELDRVKASALDAHLREIFPGRDFLVVPGDCNDTVPTYLRSLAADTSRRWRYAAAFALVDQFSAEIHWETLQALASFRQPTKRGENRIELWLYVGDSFMPRGLRVRQKIDESYAARVDAMFGFDPLWREMDRGRREGLLDGAEFKAELVNLMRWKLQHELGYKYTIPLQLETADRRPLYTMLFASAHDAGQRIMSSVLQLADKEIKTIQDAVRLAKLDTGEPTLLELDESWMSPGTPRSLVSFEPPQEPWRYPGSDG